MYRILYPIFYMERRIAVSYTYRIQYSNRVCASLVSPTPFLNPPTATLQEDSARPWNTYHCYPCESAASQPDPEPFAHSPYPIYNFVSYLSFSYSIYFDLLLVVYFYS